MDAPKFEQFPRQSWESWHDIDMVEESLQTNQEKKRISFDADAIVRQAVASRGTREDRQSLGLPT